MTLALCAVAEAAQAELAATVRMSTGDLRLTNVGETDLSLVAYSISYPTPALLADQWQFIAGERDLAGDASFDSTGDWLIVSPELVLGDLPATSDELVEGALSESGGVLLPGEYLYLGPVWDINSPRSVEVLAAEAAGALANIPVSYLPAGDYNEDGIVGAVDYALWSQSFGSTGQGLLADGNADEVVNLADYVIWRDNLGAVALPAETPIVPLLVPTVIPEPGTGVLSAVALMLAWTAHRRVAA